MNRLQVIPFQAGHATLIELREHERELIDVENLASLGERGQCATLMCDGRILGIIGFHIVFSGVIYVFVIPSIYVPLYPIPFVWTCRQYIKVLGELPALNVHRMETRSLADDNTDRWMKLLGFKCEGTLEKYTANKLDYRMWAKVK